MINLKRAVLLAMLLACLCAGCGGDSGIDEEMLKKQIDYKQDDFLVMVNDVYGEDYTDYLSLELVKPGSFTGSDKNELFVRFKLDVPFHSLGLDRSIAAIYNADTLEIICQKSFETDYSAFYFLPTYDAETLRVLFIGDVTYQGYTIYSIGLYSLEGGSWSEMELPVEEVTEEYAYSFTHDKLYILNLTYDHFQKVYEHSKTYVWDTGQEKFTDSW